MATNAVSRNASTGELLARAGQQLNQCQTVIVATEAMLTSSQDLLVKLRRDVQDAQGVSSSQKGVARASAWFREEAE